MDGCKLARKECEVLVQFKVPRAKMDHIYNAARELHKAGVHFDTGGCGDGENVLLDWEFDWSLKGSRVYFKRMKDI